MISAIIPTYRNPSYLDLCLKSAVENKVLPETQIIVIVDGFLEESREVIKKYQSQIGLLELPQNRGMSNALNMGVWQTENPIVFILNDDNVFCKEWDKRLMPFTDEIMDKTVVTVNQVEPDPSIFGFPVNNLGRNADEFQYDQFIEFEPTIAQHKYDPDGRIFPFLISKKNYMMIGGFDLYYQSPFYVDVDTWLKMELADLQFKRIYDLHFYHFGSRATKMGPEGDRFRKSEGLAGQQFMYKWGYVPNIVSNTKRNNTKYPEASPVKGIKYE